MRNKEIQFAVPIVIKPHGARGESGIAYTSLSRNIAELSVAKIVKQMVRTDRCDINIRIAIVIVVAYRAAHSVEFDGKARTASHVRKRPILIVVIESRVGFASLMFGPIHRIDEQDVLPAVVVVVQKTNATSHRLWEILSPERATVMFEVHPRLGRHIGELNRPCGSHFGRR